MEPECPWWPPIRGVDDVPRWRRFVYCLSRPTQSVAPGHASKVVVWTIDTILREPHGVAALDVIFAKCDTQKVTTGVIVALTRCTYSTRAKFPSRPAFLCAAIIRLYEAGKPRLVHNNDELRELVSSARSLGRRLADSIAADVQLEEDRRRKELWERIAGRTDR